MKNVIVVIGAGLIGQAVARRVGVGKHVLLADMRLENANALVLEEFGNVIARGGAGVVIASMSGHRLPPLTVDKIKHWPQHRWRSCSVSPSFSPIK